MPGRVPCSCLAAGLHWHRGAEQWGCGRPCIVLECGDKNPLGVADGLCWAPKALFWFCERCSGAVPSFLRLCVPLAIGMDGSVPRAPGLAPSPPSPQVYQQEQPGPALALGLSREILPLHREHAASGCPGLMGLQGPPQPHYLPQPCSARDKLSSLARGIICGPLIFKKLGLKNVVFGVRQNEP